MPRLNVRTLSSQINATKKRRAAEMQAFREQRASKKLISQIAQMLDLAEDLVGFSAMDGERQLLVETLNIAFDYDEAVEIEVCIQLPDAVIASAADHLPTIREMINNATIRALWMEHELLPYLNLNDAAFEDMMLDRDRYLEDWLHGTPVVNISLASIDLSIEELWND